ncbi:DNA-binding transcription factor [Lithospermum erythrorhizon]|uniref:DNA-binding transcription factor n=1 Tax=Lithospermum erythrorhizon TaxID=34254 RepID=A0AAV3Q1W3_LITER
MYVYDRGYYRCSSSKGCPSRKQVERSSLDPTMLQITYSYEHNHPLPTTTNKHHRHPTAGAPPAGESLPATTSTTSTSTATTDTVEESIHGMAQPDLEHDNIGFYEFMAELEWFSNMGSTSMLNSPTFVGPKWVDADVALMVPIGEEDQSLFGDLGELPECSVVFRRPCSARG